MAEILTVYYSPKGQTIAPGMKIVVLEKGIRPELKTFPELGKYDKVRPNNGPIWAVGYFQHLGKSQRKEDAKKKHGKNPVLLFQRLCL